MTSRLRLRAGAVGALACAALGTLTACSGDSAALRPTTTVPAYRLVAFDSCAEALDQIRSAAKESVGPYGFQSYSGEGFSAGGERNFAGAVPPMAQDNAKAAAPSDSSPNYSGTNTQEAGVDEPDLVKTDGHRIVVVHNGVLRIIDAATERTAGSVNLATGADDPIRYVATELLLAGDHALVLLTGGYGYATPGGPVSAVPGGKGMAPGAVTGGDAVNQAGAVPAGPAGPPVAATGPSLILVDLAHQQVLSRLTVDGGLLDARQTGSIARVVISSTPRINFPDVTNGTDAQRTKVNRQVIDQATLDDWLPRIDVTTGTTTTHPQIGCDAVSRPTVYSGESMLTVLSLDLAAPSLADPAPVSVLADGQTVYSNGSNLYVATDLRWRTPPGPTRTDGAQTTIYQFDTTQPGRPTFVGGGTVPGYLVNQYAMSDRGGYLRVATTTGNSNWESDEKVTSQSGIYVLHADGGNLVQVGKVEGLGKGERIYAVRFLDTTAYVVTFKQTDPLYTVDLSNPAKPVVHGALKISGYSSYLYPIDNGRLLGIGQDVNDRVQTTGTQVSLFNVSNLDSPTRLAVYSLPGASSEAEYDPHAFLYWPADGLLVLPIQSNGVTTGVLVLHVGSGGFSPLGTLTQPVDGQNLDGTPIRRSLVIDHTLWTVSDAGLMASDLTTLQRTAWIPLT